MLNSMTVLAPAKINLGLKVFPKRADGYHDIESIFTLVNLCDELFVSRDGGGESKCVVDCKGMVLPEDNTFQRTYKAFCVLTGIRENVRVKVTKHIPAGGGLGGGSSDSSSFLKSIDMLFGTRLGHSALEEISGQVGSDVFFFTRALEEKKSDISLWESFTAVVSGRGEKIRPLSGRTDCSILLVFPGVPVSTKDAYGLVDEWQVSHPDVNRNLSIADFLEKTYSRPVREWFFSNDFAAPVAGRYPKIQQALDALRASGADFVDMSGSGSTVFGVFDERSRAVLARDFLSERWNSVLV